MRGLRRIAGDPLFDARDHDTDLQIRVKLDVPSLDCILMIMRLKYLTRLVVLRPPDLMALLHMRPKGKQLSWVTLIAADCDKLRQLKLVDDDMPSLLDGTERWVQLISYTARWNATIASVQFFESMFDQKKSTSALALTHHCEQCSSAFPTWKALESHRRRKHGVRLGAKQFLRTAKCPCCETDFVERIRLLAHWSHSKRRKCITWVQQNVSPISACALKLLDIELREARNAGRRKGSTHALATMPAMKHGKVVGR